MSDTKSVIFDTHFMGYLPDRQKNSERAQFVLNGWYEYFERMNITDAQEMVNEMDGIIRARLQRGTMSIYFPTEKELIEARIIDSAPQE